MFGWFKKKKAEKPDFQALDARAEQGDVEAQQMLVQLYYGDDTSYYPLSFKWALRLAQESQDCCLLLQVADMYDKGQGVEADKKQALNWFENTLSYSIVQGRNSPLDTNATNYVQQRIQELRREVGAHV